MANFVINESFLQQLETLQMLVKNNVAGLFGGTHQSKSYGSSCEFADYRDYIPGDDVTKIDWNAYSRFEKLYIKLFLDERQMHTKIYIDASQSMQYGTSAKADQALRLAAALAYLSVCAMDKVSIYVIKNKAVNEIITSMCGKEAFIANIGKLNDIVFEGDSYISEAILPTRVGYGDGMSIIISDFLTDNNYEDAIDFLTDKRRHVFCIQTLTKEEINPLARGKVHFYDSEDSSRYYRKNIDRNVANAYKEALKYVQDRIANCCGAHGADYLFCSAEESVNKILFEKLVNMGVLK